MWVLALWICAAHLQIREPRAEALAATLSSLEKAVGRVDPVAWPDRGTNASQELPVVDMTEQLLDLHAAVAAVGPAPPLADPAAFQFPNTSELVSGFQALHLAARRRPKAPLASGMELRAAGSASRDALHREAHVREEQSAASGTALQLVFGIFLVAYATCLLWLNENRKVSTVRLVDELSAQVMDVGEAVEPARDGLVVHVRGQVVAQPILNEDLGVGVEGAAKLRMTVEVYQWHERSCHERYDCRWTEKFEDHLSFQHPEQHHNPPMLLVRSHEQLAQAAWIGGFVLPALALEELEGWEVLDPTPEQVAAMPALLGFPGADAHYTDGYVYLRHAMDGRILGPPSAELSEVGDVRISFAVSPAPYASITAVQDGKSLRPYRADVPDEEEEEKARSCGACGFCLRSADGWMQMLAPAPAVAEFFVIAEGDVLPETNIAKAIPREVETSLLLNRFFGVLANLFGWWLLFDPLKSFFSAVPLFAPLLTSLPGVAMMVWTAACSLVVIGAAWAVYRPAQTALCFCGGVALWVALASVAG